LNLLSGGSPRLQGRLSWYRLAVVVDLGDERLVESLASGSLPCRYTVVDSFCRACLRHLGLRKQIAVVLSSSARESPSVWHFLLRRAQWMLSLFTKFILDIDVLPKHDWVAFY
jgi:hypothetical protein